MKRVISIFCLFLSCLIFSPVVESAQRASEQKPFSKVFEEAILTPFDELAYGVMVMPGISINRAIALEQADLQLLLSAYSEMRGERLIAPDNNWPFNEVYNNEDDLLSADGYFYICVSAPLPAEEWTWNNTVRMAKIAFGGGQCGDVCYGTFGFANKEPGPPPDSPPNSSTFIWYRPMEDDKETLDEIGQYLYQKYKNLAKDINQFEGYCTPWHLLPDCLNLEGCSTWAEEPIHLAANKGLLTYDQTCGYTQPITRLEFCDLIAQLLNIIPQRRTEDYYVNPYGFTTLEKKVEQMGLADTADTVKYNDIATMTDAIRYLSALGIVQGRENGCFEPNGYITREEIGAIFGRIFALYPDYRSYIELNAEGEVAVYADDSQIAEWAKNGVYLLRKLNIMQGVGNDCFSSQQQCTLEQAITIIYRASRVGMPYQP